MLSGKELGRAIEQAINKKIASGSAKSKAEIARHFKIQAPSIYDWIKKGSISKEKLPELWNYFSDVVGPEHWGLSSGIPSLVSQIAQPVQVDEILEKYALASEEKRAVVALVLLGLNEKPPEWVDSDARAYAEALEAKARRWVNGKRRPGTKEASA